MTIAISAVIGGLTGLLLNHCKVSFYMWEFWAFLLLESLLILNTYVRFAP